MYQWRKEQLSPWLHVQLYRISHLLDRRNQAKTYQTLQNLSTARSSLNPSQRIERNLFLQFLVCQQQFDLWNIECVSGPASSLESESESESLFHCFLSLIQCIVCLASFTVEGLVIRRCDPWCFKPEIKASTLPSSLIDSLSVSVLEVSLLAVLVYLIVTSLLTALLYVPGYF